MENEIATANASNGESTQTETGAASTETVDVAALQAELEQARTKLKETEGANSQLFERAKKAEGFVKVDGKWVKAPKAEEAVATTQKLEATTGELTETQLDYLDLKGISAEEDIELIQGIMKRTGKTVRQALGDDYVQTKLAANAEARKTQAAIPNTTRRSGQSETNSVDYWLAENERTGKLPDNFELRAKVVEAKQARAGDDKTPPWRR